MTNDSDNRAELAELTAALKDHAERLADSGALGVPTGELPDWLRAAEARGAASQTSQTSQTSTPAESASDVAAAPVEVQAPPLSPAAPAAPAPPAPVASPAPSPPARAPDAAPGTASVASARSVDEGALHVLQNEVQQCTGCGLHAARKQTVFARGSGSSGLCFVGEGPGADEDAQGFPFVGKAGQVLDRLVGTMGLERDEIYVCNIVKCRPPQNRKPTPEEMTACTPFLARQIEALNPEVIVCLGATAVEGLLGLRGGITRLRGDWRLYKGRIAVMPTFHPAYLLRTPSAKKDVWADMQAVLRHLGRPVPELNRR